MDGEGVLSQIRDLQSVIDGFQLDCKNSQYDSEDMDKMYQYDTPSALTGSRQLNDSVDEMGNYVLGGKQHEGDSESQMSEDLTFESCDDLDGLLEAALAEANGDVMLLDDMLSAATSSVKGCDKNNVDPQKPIEPTPVQVEYEKVPHGMDEIVSAPEISKTKMAVPETIKVVDTIESTDKVELPSEELDAEMSEKQDIVSTLDDLSKEIDIGISETMESVTAPVELPTDSYTGLLEDSETVSTPTELSKDTFDDELELRISMDFGALLQEFSSKEYPVSPVTIKSTYFEREKTESVEFSQEDLENISRRKREVLTGAVWRRQVPVLTRDKPANEQDPENMDSTLSAKNTRQHTKITTTRPYVKSNQKSSTAVQNQVEDEAPEVIVTPEEEEGIMQRRGSFDHQSRSYEQMRRIDDINDRISLYDDYFRECINAKTGLIKWTQSMTSKEKPAPMTEGYEPPSRNTDLGKSIHRSKSNLMVVTSSTSMNALRRSIMKIPKPIETSRKSAGVTGPFSPSPNSDSWLESLSTPRIKERAKSFLNFRNLTPSRGFSTPNLRMISGASQGIFNGRNRQISPMGGPIPTGRNNRIVKFAKEESEVPFRSSTLAPTVEVACFAMQPNDGYYRQWQLPSKEKPNQPKAEQEQLKKNAFNISALLNQEPSMNNQSEAPKSADSQSSTPSMESYPPKPPSLQTNMQITPSPTSESPSTTLTFHQYEPQAATEATAKRLPLRKRLTMESKVQLHQQNLQQPSPNPPSSTSPPIQEAPALPAPSALVAPVATAAQAAPPPAQISSEPALDSDNTETDEEKGSAEVFNPVVVQPASNETSPPVVKMKPLKKAKIWGSLDSLQGHATHQNSFVNMQSQFQISETPETAPDSGTKREIADDTDLPASKRQKSTNDSPPPAPISKRPSSSSSSDELYCICRKPYDKPRFMIACDECDQWFHGECVGMSERDGGLIELYYCPACSRATGKQTSWKVKCANPACLKPARTAKSKHRGNKDDESKYCSGDCGLLLARARIANCDKKRRAALEDARTARSHGAKVRSAADTDDRKLLVTLREEQEKLEETIAQADRRARFLKLVIRRQQEHKSNDVSTEEVKSLGMKAKRVDEGGICGFDSRLLWEDEDSWSKCLEPEDDDAAIKLLEEGDYHLCFNNRKCQRHAQWQKLKAAEIDLERSEDVQALQKLKKQRHQAKVRMKQRREKVTEIVNNGVIDHRLSSVVA